MKAVGLRELKNRLSEYIRQIRAGEEVLVTDRGQVVAELRPPGLVRDERITPGLVLLAKRGVLTLGAPNRSDLYPPLRRVLPVGRGQQLLDEQRGTR
ncbi:MAG TPA: type II toxin-antitoxin system prevent-host-death family antitoxin [Acidobacteriota bacterium]|jgi:antitoxin (DNA-binding transcriptional repressor) of toxin-antitoxin stability system|nr:type II toxin-antitoxin system prevent-host-death family antitoxin [Acidobacteriota bacterium]